MYGFLLPLTFDLCSSTVPEALANLRILREELKNVLGHLQRQLESQKQASECLRIRMVCYYIIQYPGHNPRIPNTTRSIQTFIFQEQEVRLQMKHLRTERDRALKSVKERLIQV